MTTRKATTRNVPRHVGVGPAPLSAAWRKGVTAAESAKQWAAFDAAIAAESAMPPAVHDIIDSVPAVGTAWAAGLSADAAYSLADIRTAEFFAMRDLLGAIATAAALPRHVTRAMDMRVTAAWAKARAARIAAGTYVAPPNGR